MVFCQLDMKIKAVPPPKTDSIPLLASNRHGNYNRDASGFLPCLRFRTYACPPRETLGAAREAEREGALVPGQG